MPVVTTGQVMHLPVPQPKEPSQCLESRAAAPLIAALISRCPTLASAQLALGIKAGASFATLQNKLPDWDSRTGFAAGVAFEFGAGRSDSSPKRSTCQKGVNFNGSSSASSHVPRLSYVEVPILLKLMVPTGSLRPMAYAGPSISFRTSCSFDGFDCSSYTSKTDYGVVLGAGLRFGGDQGFTLEGRYEWGLKDVNDPGAGVEQRTRTFLLLAGISL